MASASGLHMYTYMYTHVYICACPCACRRNIAFVYEYTRMGGSTTAIFLGKAFFLHASLCLIRTCEATFVAKYTLDPAQETLAQQRLRGGWGQPSESNLYTPACPSPRLPHPHPILCAFHTWPLSSPVTTLQTAFTVSSS